MTKKMQSILSRVLSTERDNQVKWREEDIKNFGCDISNRTQTIEDIRLFMEENDIPFNADYAYNARG